MIRKKYLIAALFLMGLMPLQSFGQIKFEEIEKEEQWQAAIQKAESSEKLIFLDIYASWCGPCKYLENNVYTDESLGEYYNDNYVNLKMDGESEFGAQMARKYELSAYPTMYYLDPEEQIITRLVGVREADPLTKIGKAIHENADKINYYEENYARGNLDANELKNYQQLLILTEQTEMANEVAGKILPSLSDDEILSTENKELVVSSSTTIDDKVYKLVVNNEEQLRESWTEEEFEQFYVNVFNASLMDAISNKDEELLERIVNDFLPVYMDENPEELEKGKFATRKIYLANTGDWEGYGELVMKEYEEEYKGDDSFLYRQSYEVINDYNQSAEALDHAQNWMDMAVELNASFVNRVLVAFLHGMKGNYEKAEETVEIIREMEKTEQQERVLNELVKIIEESRGS
jgi:thiol-disulfide isomerase/thioredoxin